MSSGDLERIATLLRPFVPEPLTEIQLQALSAYLDLLLRWNAHLNLTAVREPESIVTRHFGESLFAAALLLAPPSTPSQDAEQIPAVRLHAIDVGSGAGFPGLPLKIYAPSLRLTLIEAQGKKATFLREVIRKLQLTDTGVFSGRAEAFTERGDLVVMRAIENFDRILPIAASLLIRSRPSPVVSRDQEAEPGGAKIGSPTPAPRLGLLIGVTQAERARKILPGFEWEEPAPIPESAARIVLVGRPHR